MRKIITISLVFAVPCIGFGKTKDVNILSESKMNVGQQITCVYYPDANLYCGSAVFKPEDIPQIMDDIVYVVHLVQKKHANMKASDDSGTYSSRFSSDPVDYSLWKCSRTGGTSPAFDCNLQSAPDPKKIAKQFEVVEFENTLLWHMTRDHLIEVCGKPKTIKRDDISERYVYSTAHPGMFMQVSFDTYQSKTDPKVSSIEAVDETGQHDEKGPIWIPDEGGIIGLEIISNLKAYLPCLR